MNTFYGDVVATVNDWLTSWFGPRASGAALGPLTWADLSVLVGILLLALIVHAVAAAVIRRRMRQNPPAEGKALQHHTYGAFSKPLYVLIWLCGGYVVLAALLSRLGPGATPTELRSLLTDAFNLSVFALLFWFCFRFTHVLETRLAAWTARTSSKLDDLLVPMLGKTLRVALPVIAVLFALPVLDIPPPYAAVIARGTSILVIVAVTVVMLQAVQVGERALLLKFDIKATDNLRARQVYTQIHVIGRIVNIIIGLFAVACVLMLFQEVRHVGSTLLASAGVVGIIAGVAGQKTLANLFAGLQIALAQPMRQDDVLVVEGEWGRVEEITLSYVVLHIWDDRRLVLPLSYFIDKPFQNWTRSSAQLLGSVFVWVDYTFPVEEARAALKGIVEASELWDKRFWNLQVTDASEKTLQLRVLATASDSSRSFDLRCEVREKFVAWIQAHHPQSLPKLRVANEAAANEAAPRESAARAGAPAVAVVPGS